MNQSRMLLLFVLMALTIAAGAGCGNESAIRSWNEVSFPIMTWMGPSLEENVEEGLRGVVEAGFTVNFSFGAREENLRALDIAEELGLKLLVGDRRIRPNRGVTLATLMSIDSVIADYKDHPALFGYYLQDEPWGKQFENLAKLQRYFNTLDPVHMAYTNLFPNYVDEERAGYPTYEEHVAKFMEIVCPRVLSFDHYCITYSGLRGRYYENLEVIRKYALQYNVPFWAFTLATEHFDVYPLPMEGHLRFQLFSDLAYGAKGLQYFTYGHVKSEKFYTAPLDSLGNKTPVWYMAQSVNRNILAMAHVLRNLRSVDVYHSKPLPAGTRAIPGDFLITGTEGAELVIGHMKNSRNEEFVLLVNRNYADPGSTVLSVSERVKTLIETSKESGEDLPPLLPDNGKIRLRFEAGDGRLFRIESV